jgi:hypothetical protein
MLNIDQTTDIQFFFSRTTGVYVSLVILARTQGYISTILARTTPSALGTSKNNKMGTFMT